MDSVMSSAINNGTSNGKVEGSSNARKDKSVYARFDSPLYRRWKKDRALRQRVPLWDAWRGCLGLAALIDDLDDVRWHGEHALYANDQVKWLCLRDVPPGHFPGTPSMERREVNYANATQAVLRHGMPVLDFSAPDRDAVDFRFFPRPLASADGVPSADVLDAAARPREAAVLMALSEAMTNCAFFGLDRDGSLIRRNWARHRPRNGMAEGKPFRLADPRRWMPRPYLAYPKQKVAELFIAATTAEAEPVQFQCPHCRSVVRPEQFNRSEGRSSTAANFFEAGDFAACCPRCGKRQKWHLEDAVSPRARRRYPHAFRERFMDAVERGLPLRSVGRCVYMGPALKNARHCHGSGRDRWDLVPHVMRNKDESEEVIMLPQHARVLVRPGTELEPGEVFAQALAECPPLPWRKKPFVDRWVGLPQVCGGMDMSSYLQSLWFNNQALAVEDDPEVLLMPADLVSLAAKDVTPLGLWWDFSAAGRLDLFDPDLLAAVFAPLHLRRWDQLRLGLPGEVALDAGIGDPRFRQDVRSCASKRHRRGVSSPAVRGAGAVSALAA